MKRLTVFSALVVFGIAPAQWVEADDWYVATNGTGHGTGGWATATNSMQGAIDACGEGKTVWVSNGVYRTGAMLWAPDSSFTSNRIVISKPVTVRSLSNDPSDTVIEGGGVETYPDAVRCVAMTNGAALLGFTLSGGRCQGLSTVGNGGGVWSISTDSLISNCVITDCRASYRSGTSCYGFGGGAYRGTLYDCVLTNGLGLYSGGAELAILYNCAIINNKGQNGAGGLRRCTAYNCLIKGNISVTPTVRGGGGALDSSLYDCLIAGNSAGMYGGGVCFGHYAEQRYIYNCTVVGNTAGKGGGGIGLGLPYTNLVVVNTIVYSNEAPQGEGENCSEGLDLSYSCTFPAMAGTGNISDDPLFVNSGADYHLQPASPCINTGTNGTWTTGGVDFDGRRRVFAGIVDMGCYEFFRQGTMCSVR